MIRLLDADGDGQVNFPEFHKMATGASLAPIGVAIPPPIVPHADIENSIMPATTDRNSTRLNSSHTS